jgi:transcription factor CRZ1
MPDRGKLINLAGFPTPSSSADSKRIQKHPANYQCNLCTKRFTRAYNLRSHLRTHTDERPFVCTVCGKAFARQHDRKRHEGLHTGEKKYVCAGTLMTGQGWGCNRRFARADALGRHFRSEAGRICIRPLLDEEKARNQAEANFNRMQAGGMLDPNGQMVGVPFGAEMGNPPYPLHSGLPMAILEQYPILRSMDWDSGGVEDERSDVSGAEWDGDDGYARSEGGARSERGSWDGSAQNYNFAQNMNQQGGVPPPQMGQRI